MIFPRPNRRQALAGAGAALALSPARAQYPLHKPIFRALLLAERGSDDHQSFVDAGKAYIASIAPGSDFAFDSIDSTSPINDEFLAQYDVFIQLNHAPYAWTPIAQAAFERYITLGKGGWVGFHHAALLGDFDGYPMSPWFSKFMGGIRFTHYLPDFASATVRIEDRSHPLAKGLPESFVIPKEEWYTWDRSPRPNVHVIANVDEASYRPSTMVKMGGDHPVIWSNPHYKARNVYIFMGHYAGLFSSPEFVRLFQNAIFWGAGQ
jgi:type 1 glutamine amidotransferase